jgi:peptide deformylase
MEQLKGEALNLRIFPDPILRQSCEPVERFDTELRDLIDEMHLLMRVREGIGLAAPQVGITKRLLVCGIENRSISLINPSIAVVGGQAEMIEGCLSLPEVQVNITRSECLLVTGYDLKGQKKQFEFTGLWARVVQHELGSLGWRFDMRLRQECEDGKGFVIMA